MSEDSGNDPDYMTDANESTDEDVYVSSGDDAFGRSKGAADKEAKALLKKIVISFLKAVPVETLEESKLNNLLNGPYYHMLSFCEFFLTEEQTFLQSFAQRTYRKLKWHGSCSGRTRTKRP